MSDAFETMTADALCGLALGRMIQVDTGEFIAKGTLMGVAQDAVEVYGGLIQSLGRATPTQVVTTIRMAGLEPFEVSGNQLVDVYRED